MSDTLRDQLLGLGFKPVPKPPREPAQARGRPGGQPSGHQQPGSHKPGSHKTGSHKPGSRPGGRPAGRTGAPDRGQAPAGAARKGGKPPRTREDIDLAKAYAIRAQREKDERIEAERLRQEEARLRREARAKLEVFLKDKSLNDAGAEIARHFPYGGKIKRVYVNADQLKALNAGELGVVQLNGRYVLVSASDLAEAEAMFAPCVALRVDPDAPAGDDPYADPQYQVPDDLVW